MQLIVRPSCLSHSPALTSALSHVLCVLTLARCNPILKFCRQGSWFGKQGLGIIPTTNPLSRRPAGWQLVLPRFCHPVMVRRPCRKVWSFPAEMWEADDVLKNFEFMVHGFGVGACLGNSAWLLFRVKRRPTFAFIGNMLKWRSWNPTMIPNCNSQRSELHLIDSCSRWRRFWFQKKACFTIEGNYRKASI